MEELAWGDSTHPWIRPGQLFTRGPGTYKIPAFDDAPVDFRVTLLDQANNPFTVHSSKAIGEPPFFMAASAFFATKKAIQAARAHHFTDDVATTEDGRQRAADFVLDAPATSERIRMACLDTFTEAAVRDGHADFRPEGSW